MRRKRGAIRSTSLSSPRAQSTASSLATMTMPSMAAQITLKTSAVVLGRLIAAAPIRVPGWAGPVPDASTGVLCRGAQLRLELRQLGHPPQLPAPRCTDAMFRYISLSYSATILAQQVIALHTELQRPKPL